MINKNRFGVANDKKLLRKIGKQWVTVSALTLVLLGGGAVASSIVTHADTTAPAVEAQDTNSIKEKINSNLDKVYQATQSTKASSKTNRASVASSQSSSADKPSNIESQVTDMYHGLMLNSMKPSNNSNSSSVSSVSTKSSVANNGSISVPAKPSFNSAYQSYMAKMSGTDSEVAKDNDGNAKNNNSNQNNQNKPVIKHNLGDTNYFTGATHTSTDDGLNYTAYANGGVEFTGGTANSDLSKFSYYGSDITNQDVSNAKAIKFDNNIDTSHVTNMSFMLYSLYNVQLIDLGSNFNTSNVTNMDSMFNDDKDLQYLNLGSKFDTRKVTDFGYMFDDNNIQTVILSSHNTRIPGIDFGTGTPTLPPDVYQILPEKDKNGKNYTLPTSNDFSKGNIGTFVNYRNPAPNSDNAIINFQSNGKAIKTITTPKQKFATPINLNNFIPTNYELVNPNQRIVADGGIHIVPVKINYDAIINSLVNEASSESAAIASYKANSASISNADKWVQSNSNSAQSADSWIASNSSNATHASSQVNTNSSAISSLSASTKATHSADSNSIASLSNSVASASTAISSNSTTDSSIVNSLASSASHAMVVGTAFLTLLYKKGPRTDGQVLRLHINGNIGDSDIVINPQDYDRDGYSVASSDNVWPISFKYSDVTKVTHDFSRYNVENTFTYQAKPTKIQIEYIDTQTGRQAVDSMIQTFDSIAYDGDTLDLQDDNPNKVIISVDGNKYLLNLPQGYHLVHSNNYIKVTANGTYVKPVTTVGGTRMLRMPLMKLTLGITPHFRKPASSSSVAPKPSSASSVTPQPASSASTEPSSASVVPSSASQSVASSTSTASNTIVPSSTAPVTPNVTPSSATSIKASSAQPSFVAPASVSVKPSSISTNKTIARSVIRHVSHKHVIKKHAVKPTVHHTSHKEMAKHDTQRLNHQITQNKHKLNIVEHHIEARKATIRKATNAKRTIKHAKRKLHYLRRNKRHVAHALRRITRNKVAIKRAKRTVRTAKQARPSFVHAKAAPVEPTTDKSTATSVKAPVVTPKVHAKSTATTYANRKKLPQTSEATDHAGIVAIILMIMSVILAGFDKAFGREHN